MITLTEKAVQKIKEIAESEGISPSIRIKCVGGGCSGISNDMNFEEIVLELDEVFEQDGIKMIIDPISISYLEKAEVDYLESEFQSGFRFNIPNSSGNCGCGKSYSY